ncbi:BBF_collapsed_G0033520.mRNA.1.CDS.1 [Saccharomyces cerevisiae]|nr:BBF_collapsed_G0033520.mRNA.1.CDS.1 [Saccharomyces cerevisiae]
MRNVLRLLFLTAFVAIGSLAAVLGVDYGQQNIKAIVVSPQAPLELVLTPEAKRKEISGLSIKRLPGYGKDDPNGIERIYGSAVGSLATRFPQNTLLHLKPLLGKSLEDETTVTLYSKQHPGLEMVSTNRSTIAFLVDNVEYPLEELVAMNVQEIANRANSLLKDRDARTEDFVNKMSFTIPDFFDQHQRKALLDASSITTGIEETYLVSEGMSVAVNFVLKQRQFPPGEQQHYIVYDMGSGSIKASMFSILQPEDTTQPVTIEFEGYGYNPHLGGAKFTMDIGNLIENKFLETHPAIRTDELHANPKALAKINQAAEKAKLILSANSEASINIESLINDIDFRTSITRQEFEEFIADSLLDIVKPINDAVTKQFGGYRTNLPEINGNGKLFETITVNSGAIKNSYSSDKCSSGVAYNITFDLSSDRLFSIQEVNCICQSENDIGNSKQIKNKGSRLAFTSEDVEIKRLSPSERSRLHEHIKLLDKQDKERFQFQENLNVLESNLYDARNLLMDDEVMQNGPKSQVEELSEMVKVYLDWLEDASFNTDPEDIVSRIREIGILKKKIELYMDSAKEPLNSQQFKGMLEEGHKLLQAIETHKNTVEEFLSQFETEFADTIDNVREEFKKIKQPAYVSKALSTWEETLTSFKNSISEIEKFLAKNLFGEDLREHLFEIKLQFDMYRTKLEEKLRLIKSGDESRLNEIKKLHLRNFRLQKRKEEKLKRKLEQEKSRNNNETESTVINSADDKTTIVNDKTTESNPSSEEDILHDEL